MSVKITKTQREVLRLSAEPDGYNCYSGYAPRKKLIALGLVTSEKSNWGGGKIRITDAGRAVLEQRP